MSNESNIKDDFKHQQIEKIVNKTCDIRDIDSGFYLLTGLDKDRRRTAKKLAIKAYNASALSLMEEMIEVIEILVSSQSYDAGGQYKGLNISGYNKPSVRMAIEKAEPLLQNLKQAGAE